MNTRAASALYGETVRNLAGEILGQIQEIMLDLATGRIAYAVLAFGAKQKLFAIPWTNLKRNEEKNCFILEADRNKLEIAPGIDRNNWPDMADSFWGTGVYRYYDAVPYYI